MIYSPFLISLIEVVLVLIPALLTVAYVTVAERKTMASMQRRLGPNIVGYYGLLQAFADALKLLIKEYISPTQANIILFFLGPIITLIFGLLGYAVIPYGPGLTVVDLNLGIFYILAVSSLSTYGILLAGWKIYSESKSLSYNIFTNFIFCDLSNLIRYYIIYVYIKLMKKFIITIKNILFKLFQENPKFNNNNLSFTKFNQNKDFLHFQKRSIH